MNYEKGLFEQLFTLNNYNGIDVLPYRIITGKGNTIISAPHSVNQVSEDKFKPADILTGTIALNVALKTGSHLIIKTSNQNDNANREYDSGYKQELLNYIEKYDIKYLLDIHGLKNEYGVGIDLGVNGFKNVQDDELLIREVKEFLEKHIKNITVDKIFKASGEYIISSYISSNSSIKAIQMEISRDIRESEKIVSVLSDLVIFLNNKK